MLLRFITLLSIIVFLNKDLHSQVMASETKKIDIQIGDKFDNIEGHTIDGKFIDNNYFNDKISLINITIEGCGYCVQEIKYLNEMRKSLDTSAFNIVSIYAMQEEEYTDYFNFARPIWNNPLKLSKSTATIPY